MVWEKELQVSGCPVKRMKGAARRIRMMLSFGSFASRTGTSTIQMAYDDAARTLTITDLGKQPDSGEL